MARDRNGNDLQPGDEVNVRCRVTIIEPDPGDGGGAGLELTTVDPGFAGKGNRIHLTARQVEKVKQQEIPS